MFRCLIVSFFLYGNMVSCSLSVLWYIRESKKNDAKSCFFFTRRGDRYRRGYRE